MKKLYRTRLFLPNTKFSVHFFQHIHPPCSRDKRRLPLTDGDRPIKLSQLPLASVSEMVAVTDGDKPIKLREAGLSQTRPRTYQQLIRQSRNIEINQMK